MDTHNDNDGRRSKIRTVFTSDPLYRRAKDAMLIVVAAIAAFSAIKDAPILSILQRSEKMPTMAADARSRIWDRLADQEAKTKSNEQNIAVLQASIRNIETNQVDIKQDVRELLRQVGEIRTR